MKLLIGPLPQRNRGAEGDRTPDLLNANQALSHLSYCPPLRNMSHSEACGLEIRAFNPFKRTRPAEWWAEVELHH